MSSDTVTVLHSLAAPDGPTKYAVQMESGAPPNLTTRFFSWRSAIFGRYDVFHIHWPEFLLRNRKKFRQVLQYIFLTLLLIRLRVSGTPIVRTLHNTQPHEHANRLEGYFLKYIDRRTDCFIRLNPTSVVPSKASVETIPHGHYIDRFSHYVRSKKVEGRLLYFGLIRPYKGVEQLIDAFASQASPNLSLRIVGNPLEANLRDLIEKITKSDSRVSSELHFVSDEVLVKEFSEAELVVLPYREMHNSGVLLVAASLARPVLVPATDSNKWLAEEIGSEWVLLYDGDLDADLLYRAILSARRTLASGATPNLEGRSWDEIGRRHKEVYDSALASRRQK